MIVLSVAERSGVWGVTLDGRFYGDYSRQEWAKKAALEHALELRQAGKCARVEISDDQGNVTPISEGEPTEAKRVDA